MSTPEKELMVRSEARQDSIKRMCEIMLETPPVKTDNVDGRMRELIESWQIDTDGRVTGIAEAILSACMYAAKVTLSSDSWQRCFIQDLAAALNRRKLLGNDRVEDFTEEGYRYLQSP